MATHSTPTGRPVLLDGEDVMGHANTLAGANIVMQRELRLMAKRSLSRDILDYPWRLVDNTTHYDIVAA